MKYLSKFVFLIAAAISGMTLGFAVQNATTVNSATNTSGYYAPQRLDASGNLNVNLNASSATIPVSLSGASAVNATIVGSTTLPVSLTGASAVTATIVGSSLLPVSEAGTSSTLAVSGVPVVIKAAPGTIVSLNVISASGVGAIYDASTTASAVAATEVAAIPATVGATTYNFPLFHGLVIDPASSVISVNYR